MVNFCFSRSSFHCILITNSLWSKLIPKSNPWAGNHMNFLRISPFRYLKEFIRLYRTQCYEAFFKGTGHKRTCRQTRGHRDISKHIHGPRCCKTQPAVSVVSCKWLTYFWDESANSKYTEEHDENPRQESGNNFTTISIWLRLGWHNFLKNIWELRLFQEI